MEIGEKLKEARETKDISLDTLQETTKIQKRYLLAIEQGNFHVLPGKFYARAFIKEYAAAVGLDPDELLADYEVDIPKSEDDHEIPYTRMQRTRAENRASKSPAIFSIMPTVIVIILVIGIVAAAIFFYQKAMSTENPDGVKQSDTDEVVRSKDNSGPHNDDVGNAGDHTPGDTTENNEDAENNADVETNEPGTIEPEFNVIEVGTGSRPESIVEINHVGEEVIISFEPTGTSWLDIKNEQGQNLLGLNTAEDTPVELDISDEKKIRLNIGNATFLPVIKINDIQLEYPVDSMTQSIWIEINKDSE